MTKLKKKTKNDINIKNMTKKWTKSIKINKKKNGQNLSKLTKMV